MSHAMAFDTLAYSKRLIEVGVPQRQAEVQAETFAEIIEDSVATKQDIQEINRELREMELRLKQELTIRLGAMMATSIAVVATLVKLL